MNTDRRNTSEAETSARASFHEPRAAQKTFVFGAATSSGGSGQPFGTANSSRRPRAPTKAPTPRKTAASSRASAASAQTGAPPSHPGVAQDRPAQTAEAPFTSAAGTSAMRTPGIRRAKARVATPASDRSSSSTIFDGMAWSPCGDAIAAAEELGSKLRLDEQQQQQPREEWAQRGRASSSPASASVPSGFVFTASPSSSKGDAGLRPHHHQRKPAAARAETSHAHHPAPRAAFAAPGGLSPPQPFVFGRVPPSKAPSPLAGINVGGAEQQQRAPFVSISQLRDAPGAPHRRRPRRAQEAAAAAPSASDGTRQSAAAAAAAAAAAGSDSMRSAPPQESLWEATATHHRHLGNEAFQQRRYDEARRQYTDAVNSLMFHPAKGKLLAPLLSNRAAAALALGQPLEALQDCRMGLQHDPTFLKCLLRMATCYCRLGRFAEAWSVVEKAKAAPAWAADPALVREVEQKEADLAQAESIFYRSLQSLGHNISPPPTTVRASSPQQQRLSLEDALKQLEAQAVYFPHSQAYFAARTNTLLRLGRVEEAAAALSPPPGEAPAPWRVWLKAQTAFHQGRAHEALQLLADMLARGFYADDGDEALEHVIVPLPPSEELKTLIAMLESFERLRQQGNEAIGAKQYAVAVTAYTEAVSSGKLSPALAAVLHCNRAAAQHGLGKLALAIADCCRAKALLPGYAKAHSRLASILSDLRMHKAAAEELSAALESRNLPAASRLDYQKRLAKEREAAQGVRRFQAAAPADHYRLLDLQRECSTGQVRKAYKQLALQQHPDKAVTTCKVACQLGSTGALLAETAAAVLVRLQEAATWLFKCLSEAHDVLSSDAKREEFHEELASWEVATAAGSTGGSYWHNNRNTTFHSHAGGARNYGFGHHYYSQQQQSNSGFGQGRASYAQGGRYWYF